ncbi:hypothetical protein BAE44_0008841 [Dichanthelium oligosanthes]|uniref:Suppressor of white apricot N-terminal domain-containing protein n=1 Tax=Dichanthelium oligosanthes TaxID=888268 RepID=A0A1E5VYF6_9POAL|nr:hypothetical protein BAE44_0008841 [Dichanthelium oligosanthes]
MWHEARRSERKVHDLMDAARRRAQRRAAYLARRRGDPQQALQVSGTRCRVYRDDALYQATEDQQGLIPWNGKQDFLIDRPQPSQPPATKGAYSQVGYSYKGDANEESEDLNSDDDDEEEEDDDDDKDFSSDDSSDERMESIAKEFGVKRYNWLVYMDKKAKEEEKRQKEIIKGDPSIKKLSRRERRKASQIEREKEREAARSVGRVSYRDPYREQRRSPSYEAYSRGRRSRSRSRSRSPSYSRRHGRGIHAESSYRSKPKAPRVEYITEFGGSDDSSGPKVSGISPPSSPIRIDIPTRSGNSTFNIRKYTLGELFSAGAYYLGPGILKLTMSSGGQILEALHSDPASSLSVEQERSSKLLKPLPSTSAALAKLSKGASGVTGKAPQTEKKETPQERLKRIMSKQLNKQIRKDTAAEIAKKREQERQRQEKLAEVGRYRRRSRSRSLSRSPPRSHFLDFFFFQNHIFIQEITTVRSIWLTRYGFEGGDIAEAVAGAEAQEGTVLARAPVPGHPLAHQGTEAVQDTENIPALLMKCLPL